MDCATEARGARPDRRAVRLDWGTLLGFRIVVLHRDSAPSSAPQPQTQWRGPRLPTTCALWRKFEKNPQTPPIDPFCTPACENDKSYGARKTWMQIPFLLCEPRFGGDTRWNEEGGWMGGESRSCLTCAKCGAMGNCHTSGSSPRSGAGFSALLCSNAGSWTRSRTPGNFSLGAPSTKALL